MSKNYTSGIQIGMKISHSLANVLPLVQLFVPGSSLCSENSRHVGIKHSVLPVKFNLVISISEP